jgi:hypothetical protein
MILNEATRPAYQAFDLQFLVELRGFEPLTPSMRIQCSTGQTGQVTASAQVSGLRMVTITASEAAWPSLATPIPLPKSDTAEYAVVGIARDFGQSAIVRPRPRRAGSRLRSHDARVVSHRHDRRGLARAGAALLASFR